MSKSKLKICHISTLHSRYDTRIFLKECISLSKQYEVCLIVADGYGDEKKENIKIYDIGKRNTARLKRFFNDSKRAIEKAEALGSDIYHIHDPELLPQAVKLKKNTGKKVIFDAHEDLPKQIQSKPYLNRFSALIIAKAVEFYEKKVCKKVDYIVAATPAIRDKFYSINQNSMDINNYPLFNELFVGIDLNNKLNEICFIGSLSKIRGISEAIKALEIYDNCILNIAGEFHENYFLNEMKLLPGWVRVNYLGFQDRENVKKLIAKSSAGLVTFLPFPNHIDAQPNKMFEYMSAGLPVIASNFPLWREIVEGNECGICVDPQIPAEIASAIKFIVENPVVAEQMGKNGRKAIIEKYNWENEEKKLFWVYEQLLKVN